MGHAQLHARALGPDSTVMPECTQVELVASKLKASCLRKQKPSDFAALLGMLLVKFGSSFFSFLCREAFK